MSNEPETAKGSLDIFSHKYLFHRSVQPNLPVFSNNVLPVQVDRLKKEITNGIDSFFSLCCVAGGDFRHAAMAK